MIPFCRSKSSLARPRSRNASKCQSRCPGRSDSGPQLLCRRFHLVQGFLPEKFRRVDSNNCKTLLFVFVVPAPQLGDNVLAVNSAVGPKFNHDNPALQVIDRKRVTIKPRPTGNLRSRFPGSKGLAVSWPKAPSRQCNREKKPIDKAKAQNFSRCSKSTASYTMTSPFHT